MCGYGIMLYSDEKYEGEWKNNQKHGYGILYGFKGSYKGECKDNKKLDLKLHIVQNEEVKVFLRMIN